MLEKGRSFHLNFKKGSFSKVMVIKQFFFLPEVTVFIIMSWC